MEDELTVLREATAAMESRVAVVDESRPMTLEEVQDVGSRGEALELALAALFEAGGDAASPAVAEAFAVMERGKELLRSLEPPELFGAAYQTDAEVDRRN